MPDIGYVNGRFSPLSEAVVPVEDRGFQFGDGVYEVIRTYGGRPFQLEAHLARLERSAAELMFALPLSLADCRRLVQEATTRAAYPECKIYIQITRGVAPRDHQFPADASPTVVITIREMRSLAEAVRRTGVQAITIEDFRWGRCDIKSVNLLANVLARQKAKEAGVFEAIFVRQGAVLEGSVSNLFIVDHNELVTAPEGPHILSGVTRAVVLELAREAGLRIREQAPAQSALYDADEAFLTGTTVEVLPLVRIDGRSIGSGAPGPVATMLAAQFGKLAV